MSVMPSSTCPAPRGGRRRLRIWGLAIGAILTVAPPIAAVTLWMGARHVLLNLGPPGTGDPVKTMESAQTALKGAIAVMVLWPVGLVILIVSLVAFREAEQGASSRL